ncbi:(-)-germacrene D synthase [Sarracenia purpurea var. burkii]
MINLIAQQVKYFEIQSAALLSIVEGHTQTRDSLHERFKKFGPLKFDGSPNPFDAEECMKKLEEFFEKMEVTDELKVMLAMFMFKRESRRWWDVTKTKLTNLDEVGDNHVPIKAEFAYPIACLFLDFQILAECAVFRCRVLLLLCVSCCICFLLLPLRHVVVAGLDGCLLALLAAVGSLFSVAFCMVRWSGWCCWLCFGGFRLFGLLKAAAMGGFDPESWSLLFSSVHSCWLVFLLFMEEFDVCFRWSCSVLLLRFSAISFLMLVADLGSIFLPSPYGFCKGPGACVGACVVAFSSALVLVRPNLLAQELPSFGPPNSCFFRLHSRFLCCNAAVFLHACACALVVACSWLLLIMPWFWVFFSGLLVVVGVLLSLDLGAVSDVCCRFVAAFLLLGGNFRAVFTGLTRWFQPFIWIMLFLLCCFAAVSSSLLLLLGSSCAAFIGSPIASSAVVFGSPICALSLSRVFRFLSVSFGGVSDGLVPSLLLLLQVALEPVGLLWSLENGSVCFSSWYSHVGAFGW